MDAYSRLLLSVIALCLLVLVLGQVGVLPAGTSPVAGGQPGTETVEGPRFEITPIRVPPNSFFLVRHDRDTGQTWKVRFPSTSSGWDPVPEEEEARAKREAQAAARAAKKAAAEAAETP